MSFCSDSKILLFSYIMFRLREIMTISDVTMKLLQINIISLVRNVMLFEAVYYKESKEVII